MQKFETQHNNDSEIAILFQPKRSSSVPIVKRCGHRHPTRVWCNFTLICPWLLAASIVLVDEGKQRRKGWGGRKGKQRKDGQREEGGRRQPDEQTCAVIRAWGKEAGVMWIIHHGPHTFAMFLESALQTTLLWKVCVQHATSYPGVEEGEEKEHLVCTCT